MSLLFFDGFDHYAVGDAYGKGWNELATPSISAGNGRNGTDGVYMWGGQYWIKGGLGNLATFIVGVAYKPSPTSNYFLKTLDGSTIQLQLYWDSSTGYVKVYRNTTLLGTSSFTIAANSWYYFELKATIHDSTGSYELRINGQTAVSDTGIDTSQTGNAYANKFGIYNTANDAYFDDFYICDNTGGFNDDFLGDVRVEVIFPDGAGNSTQWTPIGEASNYLCVDETSPDDDTTYVTSSGTSELDLYTYDNISVGVAEVYGIQILPHARKDDAGEVILDHYVRVNSTDYVVGSGSMSDSYTYYPVLLEESPDTSTQWTLDEINALEVGVNRSA